MERVTAADGTRIGFERRGEGPPLLLVHGTAGDRHVWDAVVPDLSERFTVYAVDRRGRGGSGDGEAYDVEREFEDVAAVADAADGPVNLLGHSYGALCAVGAAPLLSDLDRMVLYEPPLWTGDEEGDGPRPTAAIERMEELVARGEDERVLEAFYEDVTGNPERLAALRNQSGYDHRVAAATTIPREIDGRRSFRPTPETYPGVAAPTLLLVGSETSPPLRESAAVASDLFPNGTVAELDGRGHGAINAAPEAFAETVLDFLTE